MIDFIHHSGESSSTRGKASSLSLDNCFKFMSSLQEITSEHAPWDGSRFKDIYPWSSAIGSQEPETHPDDNVIE